MEKERKGIKNTEGTGTNIRFIPSIYIHFSGCKKLLQKCILSVYRNNVSCCPTVLFSRPLYFGSSFVGQLAVVRLFVVFLLVSVESVKKPDLISTGHISVGFQQQVDQTKHRCVHIWNRLRVDYAKDEPGGIGRARVKKKKEENQKKTKKKPKKKTKKKKPTTAQTTKMRVSYRNLDGREQRSQQIVDSTCTKPLMVCFPADRRLWFSVFLVCY